MSFIISFISSIFSSSRGSSNSSVDLNSADLDALSSFLQKRNGEVEGESTLEDEKTLLAECKSSLEEYYNRERFLGIRIERYRKLIDQRRDSIMIRHVNAVDEDDLENRHSDSLDGLQRKLDTDQSCLQSVIELHKDIVAQIEILRRRIDDIECKMNDIDVKRKECQEIWIAAAAGDHGNRLSFDSDNNNCDNAN